MSKRVLTESDIRKIRRLKRKGYKHAKLARDFNVSEVTISNIVNYKTYSDLPDNLICPHCNQDID